MAISRRSEGKVAQLTTGLNQRLAVLGEREQQVAAIDSQLKERTAAMETVDQHLSDATAALNRRLGHHSGPRARAGRYRA